MALIVGAITAPLNSSRADTKPIANPSYSLKVAGSNDNKFIEGAATIGLDLSANVGDGDTIPAGTTITINVGDSINGFEQS